MNSLTTKIAFGSCAREWQDLPIFDNVVNHDPDIFIFLGDNIYGDTKVMDTLKGKYNRLASKASFKNLKQNIPILAIWDDHDYGWNPLSFDFVNSALGDTVYFECLFMMSAKFSIVIPTEAEGLRMLNDSYCL